MKLLFLCTHNACRSILAEAIARKLGGTRLQACSAGTQPAGYIHPLTVHFLSAAGYKVEGLQSQSLEDVYSFAPDVVITVCDRAAREPCPLWLGEAIKVHWGFVDPSCAAGVYEDTAGAFTAVMDEMERRIAALLDEPIETLSSDELSGLLHELAERQ